MPEVVLGSSRVTDLQVPHDAGLSRTVCHPRKRNLRVGLRSRPAHRSGGSEVAVSAGGPVERGAGGRRAGQAPVSGRALWAALVLGGPALSLGTSRQSSGVCAPRAA